MKNTKKIGFIAILLLQLAAILAMLLIPLQTQKRVVENGLQAQLEITVKKVSPENGKLYFELTNVEMQYLLQDCPNNNPVWLDFQVTETGEAKIQQLSSSQKPTTPYYYQPKENTYKLFTEYTIPQSNLPSYSPTFHRSAYELHPELYTEDVMERARNRDVFARERWYLTVFVYQGNLVIEGITDESGTPLESRLESLLLKNAS